MSKAKAKSKSVSSKGEGKSLVIVESPAKARTIRGFLGPNFEVEASIGHVRDLPKGAKEVPEEYRKAPWRALGVNVDDNFTPLYVVSPGKSEQIRKLKKLLKESIDLYLATDEDREGEAISWHLLEVLQPKVPVRRLVFHEITKDAIHEALESPRDLDTRLVRAQEARRIIDRLYGYEVSPLLWRKVGPGLSAGRVQSVAVRLIVERERQRMAFVSASYWDLSAIFRTRSGEQFQAELVTYQHKDLPASKDFDSATGKLKGDKLLLNESEARSLAAKLQSGSYQVSSLEEKPEEWRPKPPFTTSTLQQESNRKLGFTAKRTMQIAQSLYENGYITYMRTDSTTLSQAAINAARELVKTEYGSDYLPAEPRHYRTKVKNAQEAHEAIRPAGNRFASPDSLRNRLQQDEMRLYDMIWKRTVACQMENARVRRIVLQVEGADALFQASGKTIDFPGYLRAYVEGTDDPAAELADQETTLPSVSKGDALVCHNLDAKGHATQPPARFTEATLTRALEDRGIGRPSTYASIIETILNREYVTKRGNALVPTWTAFAVLNLLESHLSSLVDYDFTAQLEDELDSISRGEREHVDYLKDFYFGGDKPGLKSQVQDKATEIDARDISRFVLATPEGSDEPIYIRVGRFGPYLQWGERRASIPDGIAPDELKLDKALELLEKAQQGDEPLGICPDTHRPVYLKSGRFGPYVQLGTPDDIEKPKNASLLKGMDASNVDLATALKLLSLPRTLGEHPENGEPIVVHNGRFGPFVKCGAETRSLGAGVSPLEVTLGESLALLAQPKVQKREPLKQLELSPVTNNPVQLFDGRYGLYVTDGVTNASLPKDLSADQLTHERALELLRERAAAAPAKGARGRKGAKKASTAKGAKKSVAAKGAKKAAKRPAAKKAAKKGSKRAGPVGDAADRDEATSADAPF